LTLPNAYLYPIAETALILGRTPNAVRGWDDLTRPGPTLPDSLRSRRDAANHRGWTRQQIKDICIWVLREDVHQGQPQTRRLDSLRAEIAQQARYRASRQAKWLKMQGDLDDADQTKVARLRGQIEQFLALKFTPVQIVAWVPAVMAMLAIRSKTIALYAMCEVFDTQYITLFHQSE
jgi:hypothetical protein